MKITSLIVAAMAAFASLADGIPTTNELLTVNEKGDPSVPGVLGTVSELARLQAAMEIAAAQAAAAAQVYSSTTGLLREVAAQLVNRNAVVYRKYFLDAFTATLIIGPDDKCAIYGWDMCPSSMQDDPNRKKFYCHYGCTADILAMKGIFKANSDLTVSREEWSYVEDSFVTDIQSEPGPYTDRDGNVYNYCYRATVSIPNGMVGFLIISIPNQQADSDGSTVLIYGGMKDGWSGVIPYGTLGFEVTGGYVTGVTEAN